MRINPAIAFTLILLTAMFGSGIVSASWGYSLGRQALIGIRQPETRPASASTGSRGSTQTSTFVLLKEEDILKNVKARIEGGLDTAE